MVLAELARREGVFDWLAIVAMRAASRSRLRLFTLVYALEIAVTTLLSNDATAILPTPAIYALTRRAKGDPLPYLFACALIANAASFVLPISNPANLVMFGSNLPPLLPWLRTFLLSAGGAIFATYLVIRLVFRNRLRGALPDIAEDLHLSTAGKVTMLGIITTVGVLLFCSAMGKALGFPTLVSAVAANGESSLTLQGKNGEPIPLKGYWSCAYVREGEDWKLLVDANNVAPAATPSPATTPSNK